jgi:hypothetical protein
MSTFSKKGRGSGHKFLVRVLAIRPDATSAFIASRARLAFFLAFKTHGRLAQLAKCDRMPLAVSLDPQRQPHGIRRPGGRPRLASGSSLGGLLLYPYSPALSDALTVCSALILHKGEQSQSSPDGHNPTC